MTICSLGFLIMHMMEKLFKSTPKHNSMLNLWGEIMSYDEYILKTCKEDNKGSWIDWKVEICGMSEIEAIRSANDPEWGYEN